MIAGAYSTYISVSINPSDQDGFLEIVDLDGRTFVEIGEDESCPSLPCQSEQVYQ